MNNGMGRLFRLSLIGLTGFLAMPFSAQGADVNLVPSIGLTGEYNDNVTFVSNDEDDDFIGIASPALTLDYSTEIWKIAGTAGMDAFAYYDNSDLNTIHQRYRLDTRYKTTERSALKANLGFIRDTTLESELEETGIVNRRENRKRFDAGAGAFYRISEITDTDLDYRYDRIDYSSGDFVDRDTHSVSLALNRHFNEKINTFSVLPRYTYRDSDENEVNDYGLLFGWTHRYTELDTLRVFLGVRYTDVDQEGNGDDFTNWGGVADVSLKRTWETSSLLVGLSSDVQYDANGQAIQVNRLYCDLDKGLSYRWGLGFKGGFYYTRSGEDFDEEDDFYFVLTPLTYYRITENHSLQLAYSYAREDDEEGTRSFVSERNRVWLTLNFVFPKKL